MSFCFSRMNRVAASSLLSHYRREMGWRIGLSSRVRRDPNALIHCFLSFQIISTFSKAADSRGIQ